MAEERVEIPGSERQHLRGARVGKAVDPEERITALVVVRRREQPPRIVSHHRQLTRHQLAQKYGADPADLARIRAFAKKNGIRVVSASIPKRTVELAGTVARMQAAFGARLQHAVFEGRSFRHRRGGLSLPQSLASVVIGVFGLDNRPQAEPRYDSRPAGGARARASSGALTPVQVANLYGFPPGDGSGETIAIVELGGGFTPADLTTYFTGLGLPVPSVTTVSVLGGSNNPGVDPRSDGEVMLDIQVAGTVSPGARQRVYFAPNTDAGFLAAVKGAVHDAPHPAVVSISWGNPEAKWTAQAMQAMESAFQDAALLGIPVTVAAGDGGSAGGTNGLAADFPASAPHALGCGGTRLQGSGSTITSETVWNSGAQGGATGGGVSSGFPKPAYQAAINVPPSPVAGGGRGVPDVCGNAAAESPYKVRVGGQDTEVWGTGAVAPLWAGLIARLTQMLGRPVGFLNTQIYQPQVESSAFRDITSGNNDVSGQGGPYNAGPGWDACTGLGSPKGVALLSALQPASPVKPPVKPRYANAALFPARGDKPLSKRKPLALAQVLRLRLDIGPLSAASQVENPTVLPEIVQGAAELEVMVSSTDFVVGNDPTPSTKRAGSVAHGRFLLPAGGGRGVTPDGKRHFMVRLRAPSKRGIARCRIGYYFRNALVQSQILRAAVGTIGGLSLRTDFTLSHSLTDLDQIAERPRLSILTNDNGDDQHQIVVRSVGEAPAVGTAKGGTFVLRSSAAGKAISNLRRKLSERAPTKKQRSRTELIGDLTALAPLGRILYNRVGSALRGALSPPKGKDQHPVIQVLRPDTSSFVLPWGLCYDIPLDSKKQPWAVCPVVDQWDGVKPLFGGLPQDCPHNHPRSNILCPFGFLGFRYAIEQLSKTDTPVLTIASKPRCDFAVAQTLLLPDPKAVERHIAKLHKFAADAAPPANLSEGKTRDAVQAMLGRDLSLVYFFCHGHRPRAGDPDTYLAVGNDEAITADDFIAWVDTWTQESRRQIWGDVRPLIFVNACHSLAIEPETLVSYLDAFVTWGHAAGVIGTEIKVDQALAMDVAEQFFCRLLARTHDVEHALREIRLDYLACGNLFGLVYTPYCWADLRLA
jgi:kumamolisin